MMCRILEEIASRVQLQQHPAKEGVETKEKGELSRTKQRD